MLVKVGTDSNSVRILVQLMLILFERRLYGAQVYELISETLLPREVLQLHTVDLVSQLVGITYILLVVDVGASHLCTSLLSVVSDSQQLTCLIGSAM
jgi:hypothetical protein